MLQEVSMNIKKHGNKFQILYRVPGYNKPFSESFDSQEEAELRVAEIKIAKKSGTLKPPVKKKKTEYITFADFLRKYVAEYGSSKWGDSYYSMSVHRIEHYIIPYFGDRLLKDIDTQELTEFYYKLPTMPAVVLAGHRKTDATVSLTVVDKIHDLLHSAFEQAIAWGYIPYNPENGATYPTCEQQPRQVWSREDAQKAIAQCDDHILKVAMMLAIGCTMRVGEILGLQWSNVIITEDTLKSNSSEVHITQELKRCDKAALKVLREHKRDKVYFVFPEVKWKDTGKSKTSLTLKVPKTKSSVRTVYIPNTVANELLLLKEEQEARRKTLPDVYEDYGLVFALDNGRPIEERLMAARFKEYIAQIGLPKVVFHSLRHLSTSEKLKLSGGDIKAVQGDSGHAQANMVTDVYSHICDADRKRTAALMENAFFTDSKGSPKVDKEQIAELLSNHPELVELLKAFLDKSA